MVGGAPLVIRRVVRWMDERSGQAPMLKKALRYVFPDHWSFMLGEVALYAFVVLVGTGIFLTFFFHPSYETVIYDGSYVPLQGREVSQAYKSVVDISFDVKAGLLMRQTHHWAANVFVGAIVLHMMRVLLTGAFRKPRQPIYYLGLLMLALALPEGYLGYSLVDDLLSGMGLAIGYSVVLSIPFLGPNLAMLLWGREFPGSTDFESRIFIIHTLIIPVAIGILIGLHLLLIMLNHHTQFRGRGRRESNVVGTPMWPGYTLRSLGLMAFVTGGLFLLGGLVQINPIWLWGPYDTWLATNGAQPDWYLGWLIGALRLVPGWEPSIAGYTPVPNPFWGGALFPMIVFGVLFLWPAIDRRLTRDRGVHHLLDRPRDNPLRTGVLWGFFTWVGFIFFAGSADRLYVQANIPYQTQVWTYAIASFIVPVIVGWAVKRLCDHLLAAEVHPLRGWVGSRVVRNAEGGYDRVHEDRG